MTDPDPDKTLHAAPPNWFVTRAILVAKESPCRSRRGVVIYDPSSEIIVGSDHNSPPKPFSCPGRDRCQGKCGQLAVHAEERALRSVAVIAGRDLELVHVELASDGAIVACNGPSCVSCSKAILDTGSVAGIWLYEIATAAGGGAAWRRYSAVEFHRISLELQEIRDLRARLASDFGIDLDLSDIPNVLCEYDKYVRVLSGDGDTRQRFIARGPVMP